MKLWLALGVAVGMSLAWAQPERPIRVNKKEKKEPVTQALEALPEGSRVISVVRNGKAEPPEATLTLEPGDSVLAILAPGKEEELRRVLVRP